MTARGLLLVGFVSVLGCSTSGSSSSSTSGSGAGGTASSAASSGSTTGHSTVGATSSTTASTTASTGSGASGATGSSTSSSGGPSDGGDAFPSSSIIYQNVSAAALDPSSDAIIGAVSDAGGWGPPHTFKIDFSFTTLYADLSVPLTPFTQICPPWGCPYPVPDCDTTPVPVPPGGSIEGSSNYSCDIANNDCHMLVYRGHWLFEAYTATTGNGLWDGGLQSSCVVAWDLTHDYWQPGTSPYSRGDQCTSTDAAGMPIAPLLVKGSELAAGVVPHALRFILPNAEMQQGAYLHPGTHAGGPVGGAPLPYYTSHWRLKSNAAIAAKIAGLSAGAKAVAAALQTYGMFLDDGGNIALTFDSTAQAYIGTNDLATFQVSDFEVVASPDAPVTYPTAQGCVRTPLTATN